MCADYPPLTAYVSYVFGYLANRVAPEFVELHESQGIETPGVRAFMRGTVLLCDILVFFSSLWLFSSSYYSSNVKVNNNQPGFVIYSRDYIPELMKAKSRRQSFKDTAHPKQRNIVKASSDNNLLQKNFSEGEEKKHLQSCAKGKLAVALISEIFLLNLLNPGMILIDHGKPRCWLYLLACSSFVHRPLSI